MIPRKLHPKINSFLQMHAQMARCNKVQFRSFFPEPTFSLSLCLVRALVDDVFTDFRIKLWSNLLEARIPFSLSFSLWLLSSKVWQNFANSALSGIWLNPFSPTQGKKYSDYPLFNYSSKSWSITLRTEVKWKKNVTLLNGNDSWSSFYKTP